MKNQSVDIDMMEQLGRTAFLQGLQCVPALDPALNGIFSGRSSKECLTMLDAWIAGWTKENLK